MHGSTIAAPELASRPFRAPYEVVGRSSASLVATAIHAGHDLRPEVAVRTALPASTRFREEDPFTDRIAGCVEARVVVHRSRFEVDLNRPRDEAVYRSADQSWGLDPWIDELPDHIRERSLAIYDAFYASLAERLDALAERGPFVLFDVHSYNHRRRGPDEPAESQAANPDLNVGTGSLDRDRWGHVVDPFIAHLRGVEVAGGPLDVRENVRFRGARLVRWVHARYPETGCALALEFKKTFMDEWTGHVDEAHLEDLARALGSAVPVVLDAVDGRGPRP